MTANNTNESNYAQKIAEIAAFTRAHQGPIFIAAHEDPDGDAIGSILGLSRALQQLGLDAHPVATSPRYLSFLPEPGELLEPQTVLPDNSLVMALDASEIPRVVGLPMTQPGLEIINIDHHGTNSRWGRIALIEPGKAATAMIIKDIIDALGVKWDARLATPVLTGLITDTGSFRFPNTTPDVLEMAAVLVAYGAPLADINEFIATQPRNALRLQAEVLSTIEYPFDGQVVTAFVNQAMLDRVGCSWEEVESLVSIIRTAEGTQLAALLKDYGGDRVKLSLRSRGKVSAQNVAVACGGGGHVAAAGATILAPFAQARVKLLEAVKAEFQRVGLETM